MGAQGRVPAGPAVWPAGWVWPAAMGFRLQRKGLMEYFGDAVFELPKVLMEKFRAGRCAFLKRLGFV